MEWPLSSWTRSDTWAVAWGSWNSSTDPLDWTAESARSLPAWLAITRTPTKSGVEVIAPLLAVIVVRIVPSALGHSLELVQAKELGSGPLQPAAAASATARHASWKVRKNRWSLAKRICCGPRVETFGDLQEVENSESGTRTCPARRPRRPMAGSRAVPRRSQPRLRHRA